MRNWMVRRREQLQLTQEELAQRAGITRQAVSSYETGNRGARFGVPFLLVIAQALELTKEEALQAEADYLDADGKIA